MLKPLTHPWGEGLTGYPLQFVCMVGAAAGFLDFGFDQGIANALTANPNFFETMPQLVDNETVLGTILALFVLGAMFGCLTMSAIGNRVGRRPLIMFATVTAMVGAAGMAGSNGLAVFSVFRFINGFGVGILTGIVPSYVAEISKPRIRGLMMSLELVFAATGLMTAFWCAYGFAKFPGQIGWRIPTALQGLILIPALISILFSPESPRWLMEAGRVEEGRRVLERLHGTEFANAATLEIQEAIALEHAAQAGKGYAACFAKNEQCFRYRTFLSIGVNVAQQATGINMATYYSFVILTSSVGLAPARAQLVLGGLGIAGLGFMVFGCFVMMERVGRVKTMLIGAFGCMVGQILLAAGVANQDKSAGGIVAATGLYLFLCVFSGTHLPTAFVYSSEVTPLAIRTRAATLGIAMQYLLNFVVVMVTPTAIKNIGWRYYLAFSIINAAMIPLIWYFCPEVAGLTLEGVDELFAGGKVHMRRTVKVDGSGRLHADVLEANKPEGSFEHVEKIESEK
ncbi:sugar porter family MFS transporter [Rhodotorula paludigena]|uniref:sugar porter family MFS transporter n=1 Tax=Rhodotorula paludigena TaxID=86838 RepID=UPI00317E0C17